MPCLFVEHLTVIDCAYLDAARGLVGESWIVDIELDGDLDGQSMVLDFGEVKKRLKRAIDDSVDHRLLVPRRAAELSFEQSGGESRLRFRTALGEIEHRSPDEALSLIDAGSIDTGSVVGYLLPRLRATLPASVHRLGLTLRHERIDGAFYHYVHGLKKHAGLCQRIAHGHRSRIEVRVDGERDAALEQRIAAQWRDIYLGTSEDIVERRDGRIRFAYTSAEGAYELAMPAGRVDLLETDSTIEQIAAHLHRRLCSTISAGVSVRAYEGVMKGAIASDER